MSNLVPADQIEAIVGAARHPSEHIGRAVSVEQQVYILHSRECKESGIDLRDCPYSVALDLGIDSEEWPVDQPVRLRVVDGFLVPDPGRAGGQ